MHWEQLYTTERTNKSTQPKNNPDQLRTSFIKDYDRLVFSAAFRKLQNKTQVFPLPGVVFVHNRLTHSLEVASVGRSLGKEVGNSIVAQHPEGSDSFRNFYQNELGHVISAACLAHDIGNPPFGHSGEDAIRSYFRNIKGDVQRVLHKDLSKEELADFEHFEGNSNAFRVLTHAFNETSSGFNLTFTTLASIIKYPTSSIAGFKKEQGVVYKKSGYFQSEKETFHNVMQAFQLQALDADSYVRHPFVFLTEAADDICYRVIDIEDAERLGILTLEQMKDLFLPFFKPETGFDSLSNVVAKLGTFNSQKQQAQYLRARWIGLMVKKVSAVFIQNQEAILGGSFNASLIDSLDAEAVALLDAIDAFSYKEIYNYKNVIAVELAGFNVIGALLESFIEAIIYNHTKKSAKLLQLVEPEYSIDLEHQSLYQNIHAIIDFISSMTDNYAIDLYRKIKGIDITRIQEV